MDKLYTASDLMKYRAPKPVVASGKCKLFYCGKEVREHDSKDVLQYVYHSQYRGTIFDEFSVNNGKRIPVLPPICGVYFLFRRDDIVYVGQSIDARRRVFSHAKTGEKTFDSFSVVKIEGDIEGDIDLDYLRRLESAYILKFLPEYNVGITPSHIWDRGTFEVGDRVLSRQEFYLLASGARVSENSFYDVSMLRERFFAKREPVYRPVFTTDEKERFEALGGLRRIIDAGVKALTP